MRITTLIENTASREDLVCEHGLSLYIETENHRILFDAGQTGAFADNAKKLGISLADVDIAILSHGHYDHGGGLSRFFLENPSAPVYASRHAFLRCHNKSGRFIGIDPALAHSGRMVPTGDELALDTGLTLRSCSGCLPHIPIDRGGMYLLLDNGTKAPEDFRHEQYLLIEEKGKRICISGCSHRGIRNIVRWFQPDILIGGFHFKNLSTEAEGARIMEEGAKDLLRFPTVYYTGHCTGEAQFHFMKQRMGHRLHSIPTGTVLEF